MRKRGPEKAFWRHCPTCGAYLSRHGGEFSCPKGHAVALDKRELKRFWHRKITEYYALIDAGEIRPKFAIED